MRKTPENGMGNTKNGTYYYRKERVKGKIRSVYVGSSETAQLDECYRWRDEAERLEKAKMLEKINAREIRIDAEIEKFSALTRNLIDALFLINGFHQHKRHGDENDNEHQN